MDNQNYLGLKEKIRNKTAIIAVQGFGYVGFNLAKYIADSGFKVIGLDKKKERLNEAGEDKRFELTTADRCLKKADVVIITVPTPIHKSKRPDLSCVINAANAISENLKKGHLIILESTVTPGTTKDIVLPILEKSSLKAGKDFFLAFSPERIDFNNPKYTIKNIPKVIGGLDEESSALAKDFYSSFLDEIYLVSSMEVAEFSKMLENIMRFVGINLINELEEYAVKKGIDLWEVIKAAATKPFGFFPYYPSAGIAGHCIPVDPYYLFQDAKKLGLKCQILSKAMKFHEERIKKIIDKAEKILKEQKKEKYRILVIGIAVKPQSTDKRESIGIKMIELAKKKGIEAVYHDPFIPSLNGHSSQALTKELLEDVDLIMIITEHKDIDYDLILKSNKPIIDTKNVYKTKQANIIKV